MYVLSPFLALGAARCWSFLSIEVVPGLVNEGRRISNGVATETFTTAPELLLSLFDTLALNGDPGHARLLM